MQTPRNIGIVGSYGGLNHGDEAILTAMLGDLRERVPDARFTVFSRAPEHTSAHHDVDVAVAARDITREETVRHLDGMDLLLLGGGGILYDSEARLYLRHVRLAQELGIPTMAYAVGAGPLDYEEDRRIIRKTLPRMSAVTVRDRGSKRILEACDVRCAVDVTADPALLLEPLPFSPAELTALGIPPGRRLVGISLREGGNAAPDVDAAGYHAVLAQAADFVCARFDAEIVFIPMEGRDLRLSHAVIGQMVFAEHAHVLKGQDEPRRLLGLIAHLDMVIAMRLHVVIFSVLAGTPVVPLPYASKVVDFATALGLEPPPPLTRDSVGALIAVLDRAWDLRHAHPDGLREAIERLRASARTTADIAVGCLPGARAPESVPG